MRRHDECGECSRKGGEGGFFSFLFFFGINFFLSVYKQNPVRRWVNDRTVCGDDEDEGGDDDDGEQDGRPPTYRYIPRGGGGGGLDVPMNYDIFCPGNPSVSERTTSYYITSIVLPEGEQPGREA